MNEQITNKIKRLRETKGYSQSQMAELLHITRSAYANIEQRDTYSWAKYLEDMMEIFETTPKEFFSDIGNRSVQQSNCSFSDNAVGYVETLHQENRDVYDKLITAKDEQIALLKKILEAK